MTLNELDQQDLYKLLTQYTLLGIISVIFSRMLRQIPMNLSHKIEYQLRKDIFNHLTKLDQKYFKNSRTGDLMTRLSSDINMVRDAIGQGILQGIRTFVVLSFSLIVMIITDIQLAVTIYAMYIPMVAIFFVILKAMRKKQKELQEHVSELSNFSQETFSGIRCIKGFAIENRRNNQFSILNKGLIKKNMLVQATRQSLWPFMSFWFGMGMILILIIGGKRVINGDLTLGTITQFIQYLLYMQWPLLALSWTSSLYQRAVVSWSRVSEIMNAKSDIKDPISPKSASDNNDIKFNNVSLVIDEKKLLSSINLSIKHGTTLGITGPTGSGKSVLASLISRLIDPTEGNITIDNTDIKNISLNDLRKKIGYATQEPDLFSKSIAYNIGFGTIKPSIKNIMNAIKIANIQNDIKSFPMELNTILGERGVTLSGGQRQRTSIARALLKNPSILILDDVLSAVDTQTEAIIMDNLKPIINNATTLFISHRISSLRHCDKIIVIEEGKITQQGSHNDLINISGYYAELYKMQKIERKLEDLR